MNGPLEGRTSDDKVNPKVRSSSSSTATACSSIQDFEKHVNQHFSSNLQLLGEQEDNIVFDLVIDAKNEEQLRHYREKLEQMGLESVNRRERAMRPPQKRNASGHVVNAHGEQVLAPKAVVAKNFEEVTLTDDDSEDGIEFLSSTYDNIAFVEERKKDSDEDEDDIVIVSEVINLDSSDDEDENEEIRPTEDDEWGSVSTEESSGVAEDSFLSDKTPDLATSPTNAPEQTLTPVSKTPAAITKLRGSLETVPEGLEGLRNVAEGSFASNSNQEQPMGPAEQSSKSTFEHEAECTPKSRRVLLEEAVIKLKPRLAKWKPSVEPAQDSSEDLGNVTEDCFVNKPKPPLELPEQSSTNSLEHEAESTAKSLPGSDEPAAHIKLKASLEVAEESAKELQNVTESNCKGLEQSDARVIDVESPDSELSKVLEESASILHDIEQRETEDLAEDDDDIYSQADVPDVGNIDVTTVLSAEELIAFTEKTQVLTVADPVPLSCDPPSSEGAECLGQTESCNVIGKTTDAGTQTSAQSSPRQEPDSSGNPPSGDILAKDVRIGVNVITVNIPSPPLSCVSECSYSSDLINQFLQSDEVPNADDIMSTLLSEELTEEQTKDRHEHLEQSVEESDTNEPIREFSVSPPVAPISELLLPFPKPPRPKKPPCWRKNRRGSPNGSCIPVLQARKPVGASLKRLDKIFCSKSKLKAQEQSSPQFAPGYCLRDRVAKKPMTSPKSSANDKKSKCGVAKGAPTKSSEPTRTDQIAELEPQLDMCRWKEFKQKTKPKNPYYLVEFNFSCPKPPDPTGGCSSLHSTGFKVQSRNLQCSAPFESSAS